MCDNNNTQSIADYLAQLLKDKKQLAAFPNVFLHLERLLDDEIGKVRGNLFQINGKKQDPLVLPEGAGAPVTLSEKVYVPIKEYPEFNFVGRILGPRGMTTKQLEQETGCKIMVRGKGSMRDKKKEDQNRGKPNWEHLNDELHVLITVEDTENRATMKLQRAVDEVKKLLTVSDGEDELKKRQLMELAIINGTYRDSQSKNSSQNQNMLNEMNFNSRLHAGLDVEGHFAAQLGIQAGLDGAQRLLVANSQAAIQQMMNQQNAALRGAHVGGQPLILSPRIQVPTSLASGLLNGSGNQPPPLIAAGDTQQLLYAQYAAAASAADYSNYAGLVNPLLAAEYSTADPSAGTTAVVAAGKDRRHLNGQSVRQHPYPPRT